MKVGIRVDAGTGKKKTKENAFRSFGNCREPERRTLADFALVKGLIGGLNRCPNPSS